MTEKITPEKIQAVLDNVVCPRMGRAYRNRTPVTQNRWRSYGRALVGNATGSNWHEYDKLGRALYATCAAYAHADGTFQGDTKWVYCWIGFCDTLQRNRALMPNLAWTRAEYEDYRDHSFPKRG